MCVISVSSLSPLPLSWLTICENIFQYPQYRILTACSFITLLLTALFLWPLMRKTFRNNTIKRLAVRTLMCVRFAPRVNSSNTTPPSSSFIALVTSCINVLVLIMMHGRQLGWVCLGSCSADVSFTPQLTDVVGGSRADDKPIARRLW